MAYYHTKFIHIEDWTDIEADSPEDAACRYAERFSHYFSSNTTILRIEIKDVTELLTFHVRQSEDHRYEIVE